MAGKSSWPPFREGGVVRSFAPAPASMSFDDPAPHARMRQAVEGMRAVVDMTPILPQVQWRQLEWARVATNAGDVPFAPGVWYLQSRLPSNHDQ